VKRLIIVDGPDCTGKTTLGKAIARHYSGVYWHLTCTPDLAKAMWDYQNNALDNAANLLDMGRVVVLDRHWPSEYCYAPITRPSQWTHEDLNSFRYHFEERIARISYMQALYVFTFRMSIEDAVAAHKAEQDPAHPYNEITYRNVYRNYENLAGEMADRDDTICYYLEAQGKHMQAFIEGLRNDGAGET
jgi:thymidylate kinase